MGVASEDAENETLITLTAGCSTSRSADCRIWLRPPRNFWIRNRSHIATHLVTLLVVVVVLFGTTIFNKGLYKLRRFKSDRYEI